MPNSHKSVLQSLFQQKALRAIQIAWWLALVGPLGILAPAQGNDESADSSILDAMASELKRNLSHLPDESASAYFLSYEIIQQRTRRLFSTFGRGELSPENLTTSLDIDLRVGSPQLDNSRARGSASYFSNEFPVDEGEALKTALWFQTGRAYRSALEQYANAKYRSNINVARSDPSGDFSSSEPERHIQDREPSIDVSSWLDRLNQLSAEHKKNRELWSAGISINVTETQRWYVNSEATRLATSDTRTILGVYAQSRAEDGEFLSRRINFSAFRPEGLPEDPVLHEAVLLVEQDVMALKEAPLMDPYSGPAILSGEASSVFFHEVLGHRLEGHRLKSEEDGQTFRSMVGNALLPEKFSMFFDPTLRRLGNTELMGHYLFDNEGVKARRVPVVEAGVLTGFLMSRSPIEGFPVSNGHGRKQAGRAPVARQSNLLVEVEDPVSNEALFKQLIALVEAQGTGYGLFFDVITGGFTLTGRYMPNAFNVSPVMVYKVYPDGSRELVRGVEIIGTPLAALSEIVAADDVPQTFNGYCGAESGSVPVSASSPAVLLKKIEVQRKAKSQVRPPLLPSPVADADAKGA